ncbi:MAG TPA: hypothetical protein VNZ03_25775 [Terriglobales bacterium]|jgi:hypothetical protein|nr:hypothetical protein [Terriglobales bacterium]
MASSLRQILGAFTGLVLAGGIAVGQGDTSTDKKELVQQKVSAVKESIAQNQASLRQYTWTAHTEISVKGEVKNEKDESCSYGPDGKVVKTQIGAPPPEKQMGRVKKRVVEKKVGEMKDYMERAGELIKHYVPPSPENLTAAVKAGKADVSKDEAQAVQLQFKDYYKPGDAMTLEFDPATKKLRKLTVSSFLDEEKDRVTLDVQFQSLPDGTNYVADTLLRADGKQIAVKVQNLDYKKVGS